MNQTKAYNMTFHAFIVLYTENGCFLKDAVVYYFIIEFTTKVKDLLLALRGGYQNTLKNRKMFCGFRPKSRTRCPIDLE